MLLFAGGEETPGVGAGDRFVVGDTFKGSLGGTIGSLVLDGGPFN